MEVQLIVNIILGIASFLAVFFFNRIFTTLDKLQDSLQEQCSLREVENKELREKMEENSKKTHDELMQLAVSLPRDYVTKNDLDKIITVINDRFDRFEKKIDHITESSHNRR